MAFPTIPTTAGSTILTAGQADTTAARTFPSLTSLTKSAGDLLIAIVVAYQATTTNATFGTWGASFTEFLDVGSSATPTMAIGAAYKFSTGSETGTFTVTQATAVTGHACMFLMAIPAAHASAPPEGGVFTSGTSSSTDPGSFAPRWGSADTLWITVSGNGETSTTGSFTGQSAVPTNYTPSVFPSAITTDVVGGITAGVAFRQLTAASEDVGPWSLDTSNTRNSTATIAVRPASAAVTSTKAGFATLNGVGAGPKDFLSSFTVQDIMTGYARGVSPRAF